MKIFRLVRTVFINIPQQDITLSHPTCSFRNTNVNRHFRLTTWLFNLSPTRQEPLLFFVYLNVDIL